MLNCHLGKVGSESAAAKCAAATQHESSSFKIEEEKPYAEVFSASSMVYEVCMLNLD